MTRRMNLQRIFDKCYALSLRLTRYKFLIIFLNLYFYAALLIDKLMFTIRQSYKRWTTFGGLLNR